MRGEARQCLMERKAAPPHQGPPATQPGAPEGDRWGVGPEVLCFFFPLLKFYGEFWARAQGRTLAHGRICLLLPWATPRPLRRESSRCEVTFFLDFIFHFCLSYFYFILFYTHVCLLVFYQPSNRIGGRPHQAQPW